MRQITPMTKAQNKHGITYLILQGYYCSLPNERPLDEVFTNLRLEDGRDWEVAARQYDNYIHVAVKRGASLEYRLYEDEVIDQNLTQWIKQNVQLDDFAWG